MKRIQAILFANRLWRKPKQCPVLIYGASGSEILLNYVTESAHIFRHPAATINLYVLAHAVTRLQLNSEGYLRSYLSMVKPRVVITMEDNDLLFYRIKAIFPQCITIAIQNGRRDGFATSPRGGFFEALEQQRSDVSTDVSIMGVFGSAVQSLYRKALGSDSQAEYLNLGSVRNNSIETNALKVASRMVYISSMPAFTDGFSPDSIEVIGYYHSKPVTFYDYWRTENIVVRKAAEFAQQIGMPFVVLGKRPFYRHGEREHFSQLLQGLNWSFLTSDRQSSSYENLHDSDVIVAVDGTLAYEMFGRGYKVGFVSARLAASSTSQFRDCDFAFPLEIPRSGPFWTSTLLDSEMHRVFDYITTVSSDMWQQTTTTLREQLMHYDPMNHRFCELLTAAGVTNSGPKNWDEHQIPFN